MELIKKDIDITGYTTFGIPVKARLFAEYKSAAELIKICRTADYLENPVLSYIFTAGKVIKGTWSRENVDEPTRYFDESGNEIVFNQGKTWVCNIWSDYKEFISWE